MIDERTFPGATGAVAEARGFVRDALTDVPRDLLDEVVAMVSELTTNSVRHAATDFNVLVELGPSQLRIEVADAGTGEPSIRSPQPDEPSGRGLLIVEQLSDAWGVRPSEDGDGKVVWFTVALPGAEKNSAHASGSGPSGVETLMSLGARLADVEGM